MCQFLLFACYECSTYAFQYLTSFASENYGALSISLLFIRLLGENTQQMFWKIQKVMLTRNPRKMKVQYPIFVEGYLQKVEKVKKKILKYSSTFTRRVANVSTKGVEAISTLMYVSGHLPWLLTFLSRKLHSEMMI